VRGAARVHDRVARREVVALVAEFDDHLAALHEQHLLGLAVVVPLGPGRAAGLDAHGVHLDVAERRLGEEPLRHAVRRRERAPGVRAHDARRRDRARFDEVGEPDAERVGDPAQRRDARPGPSVLELAHEPRAHAGDLGERALRHPSCGAVAAHLLAEVVTGRPADSGCRRFVTGHRVSVHRVEVQFQPIRRTRVLTGRMTSCSGSLSNMLSNAPPHGQRGSS
jgi:hypothetical protein